MQQQQKLAKHSDSRSFEQLLQQHQLYRSGHLSGVRGLTSLTIRIRVGGLWRSLQCDAGRGPPHFIWDTCGVYGPQGAYGVPVLCLADLSILTDLCHL